MDDDGTPSAVSSLPQNLNDIPDDSELGQIINAAYKVELRRMKSLFSPPYLTMSTVGFSKATSGPSKYSFRLAGADELVNFRWYSVGVSGMSHVGLAVGWCSSYPDGMLFYQIGRRNSDKFKIWEGETESAGDDFSHQLLIVRSKVRDPTGTESGSSEMEVDDAQGKSL